MKASRFPAPAKFSVRRYAAKDFEALYAIDQLCYAPTVAYSRAELKWYLGLQGANCLIAEARRKKSGTRGIAGFVLSTARPPHGHIITMDVLEMYRRRGLATRLLRRAESHMRGLGVREVWLETAEDNEAGIAFWKRRGYSTRGRLPHYYPTGVDALAMSKVVAPPVAQEK